MILTEQWFRPHPFWHRDRRRAAVVAVLMSCLTALILTVIAPDPQRNYLLLCTASGFSMWMSSSLFGWATRGRLFPWHLPVTVLGGLVIGLKLAALAGTQDLICIIINDPKQRWGTLGACVLLAIAGSAFSIVYARSLSLNAAFTQERRRLAEARQAEATAQLALLQAQIEPHFLFNTLANVQSLIERDPATAKRMLEHLDHYLRASLARTRKPVGTLAEEIDLVETLLAIAAIRLGSRLRYAVQAEERLRSALVPPLLLQPLVENALKHGIEPSVAGGEIAIRADDMNGSLRLVVADTGVGLVETGGDGGYGGHTGNSIGLSNVRARLSSLYGERGRLSLYANQPSGVIAELVLPLQYH